MKAKKAELRAISEEYFKVRASLVEAGHPFYQVEESEKKANFKRFIDFINSGMG
jgi:hypothetical protein